MATPTFNPADPATYSSFVPQNQGGSSSTQTPPTAPVVPTAPSGFVSSSGTAKKQFVKNSVDLASAMQRFNLNQPATQNQTANPSDDFTTALDKLSQTSDMASKALIASIKAKSQQQKNTETQDFEDLKRGMALLGVEQNLPQEAMVGRYTKIKNDFNAKIASIDSEEVRALIDAEQARSEKNLSLLKQKMDYVKQLKREKLQALSDMYEQMNTENKIADVQAEQIYDTMQTLGASDKEAFISAVADRFGIPVPALVTALAKVKETKAKKTGTTSSKSKKRYTATNIPDSIYESIASDIATYDDLTREELYAAYPEVSTAYLNTLFTQLGSE